MFETTPAIRYDSTVSCGLPSEVIELKTEAAFNGFFEALIADEHECAAFISEGGVMDEIEFLPLIFEHFKSERIYKAIRSNCKMAFAHKHLAESEELENRRRSLLSHMQKALAIKEPNEKD